MLAHHKKIKIDYLPQLINLYSKYHTISALKRQCAQNLQTIEEYSIGEHLSNMFDKYGIKYDLEPEILKEFETISMFNDTY